MLSKETDRLLDQTIKQIVIENDEGLLDDDFADAMRDDSYTGAVEILRDELNVILGERVA